VLSTEIEAKEVVVKELREKVNGLQAQLDEFAGSEKSINAQLEAASAEQNEVRACLHSFCVLQGHRRCCDGFGWLVLLGGFIVVGEAPVQD
jgi:hypothetical protein